MIKAVLFDVGNTLIDNDKATEIYMKNPVEWKILRKKYPKITLEKFLDAARHVQKEKREFTKEEHPRWYQNRVIERLGIPHDESLALEMRKTFERLDDTLIKSQVLMPHTFEILDYLHKKGYKMAIVTDATTSWVRKWLKKINRKHYFQSIVISSEIGSTKSSLIPFKQALKELKVEPNECMMIGDGRSDMMARKLGIHTCLLNRGKNHSEWEDKPELIIHDLNEIPKIIENFTQV